MASVGPANPAASGPTAPMTPTQLRALSSTPAQTPIPPAALAAALSTAPFVTPTTVPGTFNLRDLGLVPGSPVRPGCIFRSGMLVGMLRPETGGVGPRRLRDELGVATVYDLRSARERNETPGPDLEAVGVRGVWVKTEVEETPLRPEDFVGAEGGKRGWAKNYLEILYIYRKGWADVVRGLARTEGKGDAVLVHCTGEFSSIIAFWPLLDLHLRWFRAK